MDKMPPDIAKGWVVHMLRCFASWSSVIEFVESRDPRVSALGDDRKARRIVADSDSLVIFSLLFLDKQEGRGPQTLGGLAAKRYIEEEDRRAFKERLKRSILPVLSNTYGLLACERVPNPIGGQEIYQISATDLLMSFVNEMPPGIAEDWAESVLQCFTSWSSVIEFVESRDPRVAALGDDRKGRRVVADLDPLAICLLLFLEKQEDRAPQTLGGLAAKLYIEEEDRRAFKERLKRSILPVLSDTYGLLACERVPNPIGGQEIYQISATDLLVSFVNEIALSYPLRQ